MTTETISPAPPPATVPETPPGPGWGRVEKIRAAIEAELAQPEGKRPLLDALKKEKPAVYPLLVQETQHAGSCEAHDLNIGVTAKKKTYMPQAEKPHTHATLHPDFAALTKDQPLPPAYAQALTDTHALHTVHYPGSKPPPAPVRYSGGGSYSSCETGTCGHAHTPARSVSGGYHTHTHTPGTVCTHPSHTPKPRNKGEALALASVAAAAGFMLLSGGKKTEPGR